jgi:hypothetical protein
MDGIKKKIKISCVRLKVNCNFFNSIFIIDILSIFHIAELHKDFIPTKHEWKKYLEAEKRILLTRNSIFNKKNKPKATSQSTATSLSTATSQSTTIHILTTDAHED